MAHHHNSISRGSIISIGTKFLQHAIRVASWIMLRHSKVPPGTCATEYDVGAKECAESFERFDAIQRGHGTSAAEMHGFDLSYRATVYENPVNVFLSYKD